MPPKKAKSWYAKKPKGMTCPDGNAWRKVWTCGKPIAAKARKSFRPPVPASRYPAGEIVKVEDKDNDREYYWQVVERNLKLKTYKQSERPPTPSGSQRYRGAVKLPPTSSYTPVARKTRSRRPLTPSPQRSPLSSPDFSPEPASPQQQLTALQQLARARAMKKPAAKKQRTPPPLTPARKAANTRRLNSAKARTAKVAASFQPTFVTQDEYREKLLSIARQARNEVKLPANAVLWPQAKKTHWLEVEVQRLIGQRKRAYEVNHRVAN